MRIPARTTRSAAASCALLLCLGSALTLTRSLGGPASDSAVQLERDPQKVFAMPVMLKPPYLAPVMDPTFKTTITRITDDPGKSIAGLGVWGTDARHNYQSRPGENM